MKNKILYFVCIPCFIFISVTAFCESSEKNYSQASFNKITDTHHIVSPRALEHGNRQVALMLKDRPAMSTYTTRHGVVRHLTEKDAIWQWAARKFAGEDLDDTIDWNNDAPKGPNGLDANHNIPRGGNRGFIRIRKK